MFAPETFPWRAPLQSRRRFEPESCFSCRGWWPLIALMSSVVLGYMAANNRKTWETKTKEKPDLIVTSRRTGSNALRREESKMRQARHFDYPLHPSQSPVILTWSRHCTEDGLERKTGRVKLNMLRSFSLQTKSPVNSLPQERLNDSSSFGWKCMMII